MTVKLTLSGAKLDEGEKAIVDSMLKNYKLKIDKKLNYDDMDFRIKKSSHGKAFLYEVEGKIRDKKLFTASTKEYNLFEAMDIVFHKMMNEAEHSIRKESKR
jgi:hypothetical protein